MAMLACHSELTESRAVLEGQVVEEGETLIRPRSRKGAPDEDRFDGQTAALPSTTSEGTATTT